MFVEFNNVITGNNFKNENILNRMNDIIIRNAIYIEFIITLQFSFIHVIFNYVNAYTRALRCKYKSSSSLKAKRVDYYLDSLFGTPKLRIRRFDYFSHCFNLYL